MICPNCGENNPVNFHFCGMCGAALEPRRPAGAPRVLSTAEAMPGQTDHETDSRTTSRARIVTTDPGASSTAGPSFLGLNQPLADRAEGGKSAHESSDRPFSNEPFSNPPFSNMDSFFEPDEPGISVRGIVVLLLLLAVLGAGGWWAFSHYAKNTAGVHGNSQTEQASSPSETASSNTSAASNTPSPASSNPSAPSQNAASQPNPGSAQPGDTTSGTASSQSPTSPTSQPASPVQSDVGSKANRNPPPPPPQTESHHRELARANAPSTRPSPPPPAPDDKGDAAFRRGEAYLYGRGVPENCQEAIKNLKEASVRQNAKARSTFGTMYATGHCVPRDLPTSYSWFAQALHLDPNNQILEKDLTALWNEMTPPERQLATRMKQ